MKDAKYLVLVEVGDSPYLVMVEEAPPGDGFVAFRKGDALLLGKIMMDCVVRPDAVYDSAFGMFAALHPIFDAVKMYTCCYEKEENHDRS